MSSPKDFRMGKPPWGTRKKGSKDPDAPCKVCIMLATTGPEVYSSLTDKEKISLIYFAYYVLDNGPNA